MTLREARTEGMSALSRAAVASPQLDASLLLAYAVGLSRGSLLARYGDPLGQDGLDRYRALIERRAAGTCVAYLTGSKEFRDLTFRVTPDVLVPRPDTETLVEAALEWIDARPSDPAIRAVDVCTGSGCIAVSLKKERPSIGVSACDLSERALAVAEGNALALLGGDADLIDFRAGDLLEPFEGRFDLIVSNPPYVPTGDIDGLEREVRGEPRMALDGGEDGLDIVRRLIGQAAERLTSGGRIFIEAGHDQAASVVSLMKEAGLVDIETYRDLSGVDRVTGGSKP